MAENEQRKAPRKKADHVIELYAPDGSLLLGVGRLIDLSLNGILVESSMRMSTGQLLTARLRRPDDSNLELPVKVIRITTKGRAMVYGLQFRRP